MKRLLAHVNTKNELTEYLARKTLEKGRQDGLRVVVVWSSSCRASHRDMAYLDNNQEEADTKLLLHATCINATTSGATSITRRMQTCLCSPSGAIQICAKIPPLSQEEVNAIERSHSVQSCLLLGQPKRPHYQDFTRGAELTLLAASLVNKIWLAGKRF